MTESPLLPISSPCVRNCCLNSNDICMGCFRSLAEIVNWGAANHQERQFILNCVAQRRLDADRLATQAKRE
ncbi:MAG: DUF1289 domain-containing protein [Pseudomonadota bacterium]|nr:DUF1289 domain-containing protein [Pseudomonadota bacterium]